MKQAGLTRSDVRASIEAVLGRVPDDGLVDYHLGLGFRSCVELGSYLRSTDEYRRGLGGPPASRATNPMFLGDRVLAYTHLGDRIFLLPTDQDLTPSILEYGRWEPHVEAAIQRLVKPGDRAIEAGCNVGYHTLLIARAVGERGIVHAYEANPVVMRLLRSTLFQNKHCSFTGTGTVTLHEKALTDREGTLTLQCAPDHFGSGHLVTDRPGSDFGALYSARFEVEAVRVDSHLAELQAAEFMHLDIEGAEPLALRGAYQLIARSPRLNIILEWSLGMMASMGPVDDVVSWLTGQGFRFWLIAQDSSGLTPVDAAQLMNLPHSDILVARQAPA